MITTILERTITKPSVVSLKDSFVPENSKVEQLKKVDISMFIAICSVVPLIFSKLRYRSKK